MDQDNARSARIEIVDLLTSSVEGVVQTRPTRARYEGHPVEVRGNGNRGDAAPISMALEWLLDGRLKTSIVPKRSACC